MNVLVNLLNLEHDVCVLSLMKFSLYQTQRRKATCPSVLTLCKYRPCTLPCTSHTEVLLKAPPCLWQSVQLAVHVCGTHVALCYWLNLQKNSSFVSVWPETSWSPGVQGWAPAAGQEEFLSMELLEAVAAPNIP